MARYGMVWHGMLVSTVALAMVWYGTVRYGMVRYGMVWHGMVWYGMVWYGPFNSTCSRDGFVHFFYFASTCRVLATPLCWSYCTVENVHVHMACWRWFTDANNCGNSSTRQQRRQHSPWREDFST